MYANSYLTFKCSRSMAAFNPNRIREELEYRLVTVGGENVFRYRLEDLHFFANLLQYGVLASAHGIVPPDRAQGECILYTFYCVHVNNLSQSAILFSAV